MRFEYLDAASFGPLRDRQFELDSDIVLVYGPNEAGKSSFRAALETILFGFKPADRDAHPLAQWDPDAVDNLHLEAQLRLDTEEIHSVERVLQQTGKSRFVTGRAAFAGPRRGNVCVPWVTWLSRDVFSSLYSLEISQLAALNSSVSADIDELLLPTPSGFPLRPLTEVRTELRRDHTDLWRPDNRGKPVAKQLRKQLADARADALRAAEAEQQLRAARSERSEREANLTKLRQRKKDLDREHSDSPILGELFEHRRRMRALGPKIDLAPLGEYPLVMPSQLRGEITELEQRLYVPRERLEQPPLQLDERHASVLERAPEIDHFLAQQPRWEADQERRDEHLESARRCRQRAIEELDSVLSTAADQTDLDAVLEIPITVLRTSVGQWSERQEQYTAAKAAKTGRVRGWALACGLAGLVGVGLGTLGLLVEMQSAAVGTEIGAAGGWLRVLAEGFATDTWLAALADPRLVPTGAVLLFASLIAALIAIPSRRVESPTSPGELTELLQPIDVAASLLDNPVAVGRLIAVLEDSVRHLREALDAQRMADDLERSVQQRELSWVALCHHLRLDAEGRGDLLLGRMRAALASAREQRARVTEDESQRDAASRLCERDAPLLASKREHAQLLEHTLSSLASADGIQLDQAFEAVIARREEEEFLHRRERELRAAPRFTALEHDPRIADNLPDAPWLPVVAAAREQEISALEDQLGLEQRRLGELDELLASDAGSGLARATDRTREIEAALADIERNRDRLALLESILARAEREFREDHQPDVLRRASLYLERISNGRYCRIDLVDDDQERLCVTPAGRDQPVRVADPISQGTLDQIFLCLRLGLLDHLDEDRERLPLVLDDALLRMDDGRRQSVYRVLDELSPHRQIFLLTCHLAIADEIAAALKTTRIAL